MAKVFDATLKVLYEVAPLDWPRFCGYEAERAEPLDADTSISSGAADKAIRVIGPPNWIMHIEFQSGPDASLPQRMSLDSAILHDRTECHVHSTAILLHRKANLTALNGRYEARFPNETEPYRTFRYQVIRLWEVPVEQLLCSGPTLVALAPLGNVNQTPLPDIIAAMQARFATISDPKTVDQLWFSVKVLMGLSYEEAVIERLLREVRGMEDSVTYQAIIRKGEARGVLNTKRDDVRRLGRKKYGPIPDALDAKIEALTDTTVLNAVLEEILVANSWDEAFAVANN